MQYIRFFIAVILFWWCFIYVFADDIVAIMYIYFTAM